MVRETGASSPRDATFSSSFGPENANAGVFPSLPPDAKKAVKPVDGGIRYETKGVNPMLNRMNEALARSKQNDPNYNRPMDRGPIDVKRVESTGKRNFEMPIDAVQEDESNYAREFSVADVNGETHVQTGRAARKELQHLLGTIPREQWGKNLNIKQVVRNLASHHAETTRFLQENPTLDREIQGKLEGQAEAILGDIETIKQLIPDRPKQPVSVIPEPRRTAASQAMRQSTRPLSTMRSIPPVAAQPVAKKSFFDKLKFWQ